MIDAVKSVNQFLSKFQFAILYFQLSFTRFNHNNIVNTQTIQ